jgi:hypothetical protein
MAAVQPGPWLWALITNNNSYRPTLSLNSALDAGGWSTPGKRPGIHCRGGCGATGPFWVGAVKLAPTGFRSPDRAARRQSIYQLSCPGPYTV